MGNVENKQRKKFKCPPSLKAKAVNRQNPTSGRLEEGNVESKTFPQYSSRKVGHEFAMGQGLATEKPGRRPLCVSDFV